jgi:hypothetical protein
LAKTGLRELYLNNRRFQCILMSKEFYKKKGKVKVVCPGGKTVVGDFSSEQFRADLEDKNVIFIDEHKWNKEDLSLLPKILRVNATQFSLEINEETTKILKKVLKYMEKFIDKILERVTEIHIEDVSNANGLEFSFPEGALSNVEEVFFENCDISELPSWVSQIENLNKLTVFSCRKLKSFGEIGHLPLKKLDLDSSDQIKNLPRELANIEQLSIICPNGEEIEGNFTEEDTRKELETVCGIQFLN